jgi:hypothetical protein
MVHTSFAFLHGLYCAAFGTETLYRLAHAFTQGSKWLCVDKMRVLLLSLSPCDAGYLVWQVEPGEDDEQYGICRGGGRSAVSFLASLRNSCYG